VIVCFVDIGGIVDYHCLNFLFIIIEKMSFFKTQFTFHNLFVKVY
jgi:hypothetical protein